jgi:hypothetical protein
VSSTILGFFQLGNIKNILMFEMVMGSHVMLLCSRFSEMTLSLFMSNWGNSFRFA